MVGQAGFRDIDERYAKLSDGGDSLERLTAVVDFEVFRRQLKAALNRSNRLKGDRPPYDAVLMFKVLVLQALQIPYALFQLPNRLVPRLRINAQTYRRLLPQRSKYSLLRGDHMIVSARWHKTKLYRFAHQNLLAQRAA